MGENKYRKCTNCNGLGIVRTANGVKTCPGCHGTGKKVIRNNK